MIYYRSSNTKASICTDMYIYIQISRICDRPVITTANIRPAVWRPSVFLTSFLSTYKLKVHPHNIPCPPPHMCLLVRN